MKNESQRVWMLRKFWIIVQYTTYIFLCIETGSLSLLSTLNNQILALDISSFVTENENK